MKPMEGIAVFLFIGTLSAFTTAMKEDATDFLSESRFKDLQDYNRLKDLQALRSTILLGRLLGDIDQRLEPMQKRDCYFNAGLSHSCDNEDVLSALAEARHLGSFNSPGRRRRRKRQPTMVLPLEGFKGNSEDDIDAMEFGHFGSEEQGGNGNINKYQSLAIASDTKEQGPSGDLNRDSDLKSDNKALLNVHDPKRPKRCINLWDDSCANANVPNAGDDDDYLTGGDNPGKRSAQKTHSLVKVTPHGGCFGWDENCINGEVVGSGSDDDYFNDPNSPGKRNLKGSRGVGADDDYFGGENSPGKRAIRMFPNRSGPLRRCIGLFDENCINGGIPGSGDDGDYFEDGDNPGKRSLRRFRSKLRKPKRCINLWDDSCANGQVPGSGDDDDYFGGEDSPGKRALPLLKNLYEHARLMKAKRCSYYWDESCSTGSDDEYWGSGDNPGKRSLVKSKLILYCTKFPGSRICRRLG